MNCMYICPLWLSVRARNASHFKSLVSMGAERVVASLQRHRGNLRRGMTDRQSGRLRLGGVTVIAGCGWGKRTLRSRTGGGGAGHFKCRPPCTPLFSLHRLARCVHTFQLDATKKRPSWNCSFVSVLTVKPPPSHSPSSLFSPNSSLSSRRAR